MKNYVSEGKTISFTAGGTISAGDVDVIGTGLVGVAMNDAASGEEVVYALEGVYSMTKIASGAIAAGDIVDWDVSAGAVGKAITPAAGDVENFGVCMEAAADTVTTIKVKLLQGGTLN